MSLSAHILDQDDLAHPDDACLATAGRDLIRRVQIDDVLAAGSGMRAAGNGNLSHGDTVESSASPTLILSTSSTAYNSFHMSKSK